MNETLFMIAALLTGVVLGLLFFGGLWYTTRKGLKIKRPALWFLGSYIFRMGIVLVGFYLVMQRANWSDGLMCLLGFIAARFIVLRLTKNYELKNRLANEKIKEVAHEA